MARMRQKKRQYRRRVRRGSRKLYRYPQSKTYAFKRSAVVTPWANVDSVATIQPAGAFLSNQVATNTYNFGHMRFRLSDLGGSTDFTNLYERYKITGIKLKFIPVMSLDRDGNTVTTPISPLAIAINRSSLTTTNDDRDFNGLMEDQDVKVMTTSKPFKIYIPYPKFYQPADGITQAAISSGWINTKSPAVHHFGLQWAFMSTTSDSAARTMWRVFATYYVKCSNPQ